MGGSISIETFIKIPNKFVQVGGRGSFKPRALYVHVAGLDMALKKGNLGKDLFGIQLEVRITLCK